MVMGVELLKWVRWQLGVPVAVGVGVGEPPPPPDSTARMNMEV
jgi:hypothetical protein